MAYASGVFDKNGSKASRSVLTSLLAMAQLDGAGGIIFAAFLADAEVVVAWFSLLCLRLYVFSSPGSS